MSSRQNIIAESVQCLQARNFQGARNLLLPLCGAESPVDEATQLLAAAHSRLGELDAASRLYLRYLQHNPGNAAVWNNYGNHLKKSDPAKAQESYLRALKLQPEYPDAIYNLALCQHDTQQYGAALATLDRNSALTTQAREKQLRGVLQLALHQPDQARQSFSAYLTLKPDDPGGLLNLSIAHRRLGQREQALAILGQAGNKAPARLQRERCALLQELGQRQKARTELIDLLRREPLDFEAHDMLDKLNFEFGERDLVGRSLRDAHQATGDQRLLGQLALKLEKLDQPGAAIRLLAEVPGLVQRDPDLLCLQARLHSRAGASDQAEQVFASALQLFPQHRGLLLDCCRLRIGRGQLEAADQLMSRLLAVAPHDQEAWSYRSTIWKLGGDDRYPWLCDFRRFVSEQQLLGEGLEQDFITQLVDYLRGLHDTTHAPIDQTLRGGTQTAGALFNHPEPVIQQLVARLRVLVQRHIDQLPDDLDHPLLGRKSGNFTFNGSWSVRLTQQGYHINHNHREGWLSSALYLVLPPMIGTGDMAGCLRLGQSNMALGDEADPVEAYVTPAIGKLALFPSYLWHGTVPFKDEAERMTVAFDIVPTAG